MIQVLAFICFAVFLAVCCFALIFFVVRGVVTEGIPLPVVWVATSAIVVFTLYLGHLKGFT